MNFVHRLLVLCFPELEFAFEFDDTILLALAGGSGGFSIALASLFLQKETRPLDLTRQSVTLTNC